MRTYLLKRLLLLIPTLFGITLLTFGIIRLAPGDPAALKLRIGAGDRLQDNAAAKEVIEQYRRDFQLDQPLPVQYWHWVKRLATLDFGNSYKDNRPVADRILEKLPVTIQLNVISLILIFVISIPLGIYSAVHKDSVGDRVLTLVLFVLYSLPGFWVATLLLIYFCGIDYFQWFPVSGIVSDHYDTLPLAGKLWDRVLHLTLPVLCLTYGGFAYVSRQMRASMLESIRQDYIRTARAKGLPERTVIFKHALRNSLIPILTLMASLLPALLGGSVIIETIFSLPGMGRLGFEAILSRDYNTVMAITTVSALLTLLGILLADLAYALVNPAISLEKREG